jgi:hypothetical protein
MTTDKQDIEAIKKRLEKLEAAVFAKKAVAQSSRGDARESEFKGATGGVRLLVSTGYFKSARRFGEIITSLEAKGYLYSKQAFQEALNRLAKSGGPLVTLRKDGGKVYAERK